MCFVNISAIYALRLTATGYLAKKLMGDSLQAIVMTKALPIFSAGYTISAYIQWDGFVYSMGQAGGYLQ